MSDEKQDDKFTTQEEDFESTFVFHPPEDEDEEPEPDDEEE
jgi:hypothetical protein